jgi:thiamine-monophosphate kinase
MPSREDDLIARFFKPLASTPGALGLTDDAACLTPPAGQDLVLTTDALVENVHFFADDPPDLVARKALRVNLSDLAAKGAKPVGFMLSLALSDRVDERWLEKFASGLKADAAEFSCPLFGGDTVRGPVLMINVAMIGSVPSGTMVRRAGAKVGDRVCVTGTIGDAALGLQIKQGRLNALAPEHSDHLVARYLLPQPRNALAEAVRTHASAAMDVSDGLIGDLAKLCDVSGVGAQIDADRVPFSAAVRAAVAVDATLLETALTGGDDYEIVCTVPASKFDGVKGAAKAVGVDLAEIGVISAGHGVRVLDAGREMTFARGSFSHF